MRRLPGEPVLEPGEAKTRPPLPHYAYRGTAARTRPSVRPPKEHPAWQEPPLLYPQGHEWNSGVLREGKPLNPQEARNLGLQPGQAVPPERAEFAASLGPQLAELAVSQAIVAAKHRMDQEATKDWWEWVIQYAETIVEVKKRSHIKCNKTFRRHLLRNLPKVKTSAGYVEIVEEKDTEPQNQQRNTGTGLVVHHVENVDKLPATDFPASKWMRVYIRTHVDVKDLARFHQQLHSGRQISRLVEVGVDGVSYNRSRPETHLACGLTFSCCRTPYILAMASALNAQAVGQKLYDMDTFLMHMAALLKDAEPDFYVLGNDSDDPVRRKILDMMGLMSKSCCMVCTATTKTVMVTSNSKAAICEKRGAPSRNVRYATVIPWSDGPAPLRTWESHMRAIYNASGSMGSKVPDGVKGFSPWFWLTGFNPFRGVSLPMDWMHTAFLCEFTPIFSGSISSQKILSLTSLPQIINFTHIFLSMKDTQSFPCQ